MARHERITGKEIIINPAVPESNLQDFLAKLNGVSIINIDPKLLKHTAKEKEFKTIFESEEADMVICRTFELLKKFKSLSATKQVGYFKKVLSNSDVDEIEKAALEGAEFVIVDAADWKIIPLENIIAKLHKSRTKIYTTAESVSEVTTMLSVLEMGVDGVIFSTGKIEEVNQVIRNLGQHDFRILPAKVVEVRDVGTGERVCVDTASMLSSGEGMLIGSRSNFMLLVHNESVGSSFTSPRPFRVNAGAVYCYTISPDGKTRYLSEIESGSEVLIVDRNGNARSVVVGRSKIETRPLRLIRAEINGESGTVILQNAETIRLVKKDGSLVSVTEIKPGDEVLGYSKPASGRHFGMEVDEYIVEK
jgi:3-dehydroquinate synthase II